MPKFILVALLFSLIPNLAAAALSCLGTSRLYELKHTADFYLVKSALPAADKRNDLYITAAYFQNFYAFPEMANLQRTPNMRTGGYEKAQVKIEKVEDVPYPFDIVTDAEAPEYVPPQVVGYLKNVVKQKGAKKGEPAVKVTYAFKANLEICQLQDTILPTVTWPLPKDPYLAYFMVPAKARLNVESPYYGAGVANPCASREQIGPGGKVEPWAYWYFWAPWAKGISVDGQKYDCSQLLTENVHWSDVKPQLTQIKVDPIEPRLAELKNKKGPLKGTFLFSAFKNTSFGELTEAEQTEIKNLVRDFLKPMEFTEARAKLPIQQKKFDQSISSLLIFLWNLQRNSVIKSYAVNMEPQAMQVLIKGILKQSVKPFEFRLHVSPNQPGQVGHDLFNKLLAHALVNDDLVVYTGHAGFGSFLGKGLEEARVKLGTVTAGPQYQLVAVLSCAASFYYPPQSFPAPNYANFKRDFIQSIGTFRDGTYVGAMTLVGIVDQAMAKTSWPAFESWVRTAKYDNFLKYTPADGVGK